MSCEMPHVSVILGLLCMSVALLFQIIGVATAGWLTRELDTMKYSLGLWTLCAEDKCDQCALYIRNDDWLLATRAFGLIGMFIIAVVVIAGVLSTCTESKKLPIIAALFSFLAAISLIIEIAVFAYYAKDKYGVESSDYDYSFALTIVAFLLCLAGGVFFLLRSFKN